MANQFNWALGQEGKGNVYDDGSISTWRTDEMRNPHHYEIGQQDEKTPRFHFYISPEGGLWDGGTTFNNQTNKTDDQVVKDVVQQHPAMWDGRNEIFEDYGDGEWEPEERVEMPGGGFGHADALMKMRSKLASSGWADFHTEYKLPRATRKRLRRWVDRLRWPENHTKHDAREYHITVLDLDTYDEEFAKWAKKETQGKKLNFKSTGMEMFNDFIVVRLDCPEWEELAKKWTEEADKRGLDPHKFPGGPKAHVSVGRSHDKKWPKGVPNPHIRFHTQMFNIKRNSTWHVSVPVSDGYWDAQVISDVGDPWQPGVWGKGMHVHGEPHVWEITEPYRGMEPTHGDYGLQHEDYPTKHSVPIVVSPDGAYAPAPHWHISDAFEKGSSDPLMQRAYDELNDKFDTFAQNPNLTRVTPAQWQEKMDASDVPQSGYGHGNNVLDILNRQATVNAPEDDLKLWLDSFSPQEEAQAPSPYHTNESQFAPYTKAPVVQTPHVDPPKQPYAPYNWADDGWEESLMDRTGSLANLEQAISESIDYGSMYVNDDEKKVQIILGDADENELFQDVEEMAEDRYPGYDIDVGSEDSEFNPFEMKTGDDGIERQDHGNLSKGWERFANTHHCPQCDAMIDGQICNECGYNPFHADSDYDKAKNEWYDRAWSHPGDQPLEVPNQPLHWRDDHAKDVSLASRKAMNGHQQGWSFETGPSLRPLGSTDDLSALRGGELATLKHDHGDHASSLRALQQELSDPASLGWDF